MTSPRAGRHAQATKARALPRTLSWARDLTPRARGDHVRALAARPGSSTAPHHHEIDYCRNHHQPRNQWGHERVGSSRSRTLVGPRGGVSRPSRVSRRGSCENRGAFAIEGAAGAALSTGSSPREIPHNYSLLACSPHHQSFSATRRGADT